MSKAQRQKANKYISRRTLLALAADRSFSGVIMYMAVWSSLVLLLVIIGVISAKELMLSMAVVSAAVLALGIRFSFNAKCGWHNVTAMQKLIKDNEHIDCLKTETLTYRNGGWEYIDDKWLIRVNGKAACVIYVPDMDFSKPVVKTALRIYDDFGRKQRFAEYKEINRYTFQTSGGVPVVINTDRIDIIYEMVANNGGRIVLQQ